LNCWDSYSVSTPPPRTVRLAITPGEHPRPPPPLFIWKPFLSSLVDEVFIGRTDFQRLGSRRDSLSLVGMKRPVKRTEEDSAEAFKCFAGPVPFWFSPPRSPTITFLPKKGSQARMVRPVLLFFFDSRTDEAVGRRRV